MSRAPALLVCATGGHLTELWHFAGRVLAPDEPRHWVTTENTQSRSQLASEQVTYVPYVGVGDIRGVLRCLPVAHHLLRELRPGRVISTGSGIALGFLPYLALRGIPSHYIESAARVHGPSETGRILAATPRVRTYTQYRARAGRGWHYAGGVYDSFFPGTAPPPGAPLRVVVTVGTAAEFPFVRLLSTLAPLLSPGGALEAETGCTLEVTWQTGSNDASGLNIRAEDFIEPARLEQLLVDADLVIAHCGAGSALAALSAGVHPVLAPRRVAHGEAGDDHQADLGHDLSARGLAEVAEADAITVDHLLRALRLRTGRRSGAEVRMRLVGDRPG